MSKVGERASGGARESRRYRGCAGSEGSAAVSEGVEASAAGVLNTVPSNVRDGGHILAAFCQAIVALDLLI